MGSITFAAVTAVLLQAGDPHGAFDRWGAEFGGGAAYDRYEQANPSPSAGIAVEAMPVLTMPAGVSVPVVQRVMRYRDPRLTMEVYGHLSPDYVLREFDKLKLGIAPRPAEEASAEERLLHPCCRQAAKTRRPRQPHPNS
jgi:hypothetical protein